MIYACCCSTHSYRDVLHREFEDATVLKLFIAVDKVMHN
jgi:hypothetical protein